MSLAGKMPRDWDELARMLNIKKLSSGDTNDRNRTTTPSSSHYKYNTACVTTSNYKL